eukprot:m.244122 g.244122  ORF g.244122 m.244122 type:complete len:53 (+) comp33822_c3_seq6:150-308(+)
MEMRRVKECGEVCVTVLLNIFKYCGCGFGCVLVYCVRAGESCIVQLLAQGNQ